MQLSNGPGDIIFDFVVEANLPDAWKAWTTKEGIESFFAPNCRVDFEVDGRFEILFDMSVEEGRRGSEGMRILAMEECRMISFSWNAPPSIPAVRFQRTFVNIQFSAISETKTRILFRNVGYGHGVEWEKALRYFEDAWGNVVLPRFRYYLENGRYDWDNPPDLSSYRLHQVSK